MISGTHEHDGDSNHPLVHEWPTHDATEHVPQHDQHPGDRLHTLGAQNEHSTTPWAREMDRGMNISTETTFFRLSSAVEAVTIFIIIIHILPTVVKLRNKSSFYIRLGITYCIILLIISIRKSFDRQLFYDFLETNIFRSMDEKGRTRFLLYLLAPLENLFDLSLLSLCMECLLFLTSYQVGEGRLWLVYSILVIGIPAVFLLILIIVWESSQHVQAILSTVLTESVLPTLVTAFMIVALYILSRRRVRMITQQMLFQIKLVILTSVCEMCGLFVNIALFSAHTEVVMDDLIDALIKLCACSCFLLVRPNCNLQKFVLASLQPHSDLAGVPDLAETQLHSQNNGC